METLDFEVINTPLTWVYNRIMSDLEKGKGHSNEYYRFLCISFLKVANNNFMAVRDLINKDFKFAAPAKIICRSSLELVYTLCIMACNPDKYTSWYAKAGWKEDYEYFKSCFEDEEVRNIQPKWWESYRTKIERGRFLYGITEEERDNLKLIKPFPYAPRIFQSKELVNDLGLITTEFLQFLLQAYYKPLSQIFHVAESGLSWNVGGLLGDPSDDAKEIAKSEPVLISIMCLLILLSEINISYGFKYNEKLKEIWTLLAMTVPIQKEIYEKKYQKCL